MATGMVENAAASPQLARRISPDSTPAGFTPGTILIDRYRIIGLLGRGGMGEVYRADDLKLGQPVALKFLPKVLASDPLWRERFFAEVRITRQLAHPNICRVYDVTEFDGQHFLSMEYIDGEDLASLITRVGYLSNEKALDITRELLAGLAAAHDRGVVHRDLKPANIMIDGHGRVRIMDFGLAVAGDAGAQAGEMFGTPAYMAPEQFAGKGASVRSDIYALGLILYEIHCGRKAFTPVTLAELRRQKESQTPAPPSEFRSGIDPIVERVIMRCLERDPLARPASAAHLAASLPGGDPLAAALAAGETPSPEMVAASGVREGVRPALAVGLLAFVMAGLILAVFLKQRSELWLQVNPAKPPAALVDRAREFLMKAGYTDSPADSALGFQFDDDLLAKVARKGDANYWWTNIQKSLGISFWYRQSPRPIERNATPQFLGEPITATNPPLYFSGEVVVVMDLEGRVKSLSAVPPQITTTGKAAIAPDWPALFSAAGLDISTWTQTESEWTPDSYADVRTAWRGSIAEAPGVPVRIEAAAYGARPVSVLTVYPWVQAHRMVSASQQGGPNIYALAIGLVTLFGVIGAALWLARRNLRLGRGDRRGAARLVMFGLSLVALSWLFQEHHVATLWEILLFVVEVGCALSVAALLWVVYIGFEPFVRRHWPHMLVSWTRLLSGEWRDPLLGRDLLVGCAAGVAGVCLSAWRVALTSPSGNLLLPVPGTAALIGWLVAGTGLIAVFSTLATILLLVFLRIVLRKDWLTIVAYMLLRVAPRLLSDAPWTMGAFALVEEGLTLFVLLRFGLVAGIAGSVVFGLFLYPITFRTSAWYAGGGYVALLFIAVLALYAFRTSLGSRRLLDLPAD
jgi:serine/threonine-protein kinase